MRSSEIARRHAPSRERAIVRGMRACVLALVVLASCAPRARTTPRPAPSPPRIVVAIVVDQLAAWVASERLPLLPEDGGFARLRREGRYYENAEMPHAVTDTAPGHTVLFTGEAPRESGIFANEVVNDAGERVSVLRDETTQAVGADGVTQIVGSSLRALRVPTVADTLRAHDPSRMIVALSLKDRSALVGGGRSPDAAIYFEPSLDAFVTSTAFAEALPAWALPHVRTETLVALRSAPWLPLDQAFLDAHAGRDDAPGEGDLYGLGRTFPHSVQGATNRAKAMRASPYGDLALLALAKAAVAESVAQRRPLFLAISFSSNDYVGHVFGPESREAWDELLRLDGVLRDLFAALDAAVGEDGFAVVLSADHGVVPTPETMRPDARWCSARDPYERPCSAGVRLDPDAMAHALEAAADDALGAGDYVLGVADPYVVLTRAAKALPPARLEALMVVLEQALARTPGVAAAYRSNVDPCPLEGQFGALVCAGLVPGAGAFYVLPARGAFFDSTYVPGEGTSHGTPYAHDRRVPLLVRTAQRDEAGLHITEDPIHASMYCNALCTLLALPRQGACVNAPDFPPLRPVTTSP
jgi:hypothetical protein